MKGRLLPAKCPGSELIAFVSHKFHLDQAKKGINCRSINPLNALEHIRIVEEM
jgi:hypothetical protein